MTIYKIDLRGFIVADDKKRALEELRKKIENAKDLHDVFRVQTVAKVPEELPFV